MYFNSSWLIGSDGKPLRVDAFDPGFWRENRLSVFNPAVRDLFSFRYEDFELLDYQGSPHRLSDRSGKVTLLAFWFPT